MNLTQAAHQREYASVQALAHHGQIDPVELVERQQQPALLAERRLGLVDPARRYTD